MVLRRQGHDKARLSPRAWSLLQITRSLSTSLLSCDLGMKAPARTAATRDSNNPFFFKKYCTLSILYSNRKQTDTNPEITVHTTWKETYSKALKRSKVSAN